MSDQITSAQLNAEVQRIWDTNAAFWDERMGEGNLFHLMLVAPGVERLLGIQVGERVVEVACGNGQFARRLASLGARVTATDFSAEFLERARDRSVEYADRLDYRLVDASDERQLIALGEGCFDAVVCNMALMDMAEIDPLMRAVPRLLAPRGRFVFALMHPCFNSPPTTTLMLEEEDRGGELVVTRSVKIWRYITPLHARGLGMIGQPEPHYYFHRPLSALLNAAFRAGMLLDGIEEPVFEEDVSSERSTSWLNYREIPPVLAARLRVANRD